ncbi:hypothetical protein B0H16DRAFT_1888297 [Mycena metata]|uniref:Ricin B lectin domain-containing protein n=1 Tax=Mycena metata TaxID=1033252 RepID=A0AAD7N787_9AGAR|nr:hypothetical protein B0H16DRAFT_1888297 [Mycena metata]
MHSFTKLIAFALCALSTVGTVNCAIKSVSQGKLLPIRQTNEGSTETQIVNVGFNGAVFTVVVGDVLLEKDNTGQNDFGVWEKTNLEDDTCIFKNLATGWYMAATGDIDHLLVAPGQAPAVFRVTQDSNNDGTYIIQLLDENLVWEASLLDLSQTVGRIILRPDTGSSNQRWKFV